MPSHHSPCDDSKGEKLARRLSHILARRHQGHTIDKHQLADEFGVNMRTIERDLSERLHGIAERTAEGHWQLTRSAHSTIPAKHLHGYAHLSGTERLFSNSSLSYLLVQLEIPEPCRTTQVQPMAQEGLNKHGSTFADLQTAVEHRHPCSYIYKGKPHSAPPAVCSIETASGIYQQRKAASSRISVWR